MPSQKRSPDALFKQQARRLAEFLERGGHTIKHSHALEAVAAMHGAADFHTLQHEAQKPRPTYALLVYGQSAFPDIRVMDDYAVAVVAFVESVRMIRDLVPEEPMLVAYSHGGALTQGLWAYIGDTLVASMTQVARSTLPPGMSAPPFTILPGEASNDLAHSLTAALSTRKPTPQQRERVLNSIVARTFAVTPAESIYDQIAAFYRAQGSVDISQEELDTARARLEQAKTSSMFVATVDEHGISV